ncbi:exo-alpha-sialidase [Planctomycetota bacterium]
MRSKESISALFLLFAVIAGGAGLSNVTFAQCEGSSGDKKPMCMAKEIFPLIKQHVHGSTIVELPNGDLLAAWFQGSGERWADDVAILGARLKAGAKQWSKPFVMADVPGFPDINPILFIDPQERLWLLWYTVIANLWETSLPKYRISENYTTQDGAPEWCWQEVLHIKPGDPAERGIQPGDRFVKSIERQIKEYSEYVVKTTAVSKDVARGIVDRWAEDLLAKARGENMMRGGQLYDGKGGSTSKKMGYPYFRRVGWQTRNKATIVDNRRIIVPFYSDGFSFSLMAITDDGGKTWQFSEPLVGAGNIQASIVEKTDGTLVAYMRDNGPPPMRLHISTSKDKGLAWSLVKDSDLPNPGSAVDVVRLQNGHWALACNDTERGRHSLAVMISTDEGQTWEFKRHIERDMRDMGIATSGAYPSLIQGRDGTLHVVYSYHHKDRKGGPNKTIKYFRFNEAWVRAGKTSKRK